MRRLDEPEWERFRDILSQLTNSPSLDTPARGVGRVLRLAEWDGLPAVTEAPSPDGRQVLTERGGNLAVRRTGVNDIKQLTDCGTADEPWRVNAQVYSILPAPAVWSPDSSRVVSVRADLTDVPYAPGGQGRLPIERSPHRGLGKLAFIDIATAGITWADLPANVHWTPVRWLTAHTLLALGIDLAGELWLARVDSDGSATTLVRERVPSVFPYLPAVVSAVSAVLPNEDVLWASDRDGDLRLYRITASGTQPITPRGVQVEGVIRVNDVDVVLAARTNAASPYDVQVCRVEPSGTFVVEVDLTEPTSASGEAFVVKAADGVTDLHGILFTPPDFTADGCYPVVDCVYGGPQAITHRCSHAQPGHHLWGCSLSVATALAQLGFVTVVLDSRGTPGRGRAFQWPDTAGRAEVVVADHSAAIRSVAASRRWMDLSRCGIVGTSFGAYHAVGASLFDPDLFRAVVAHAGPYRPADALPGWFCGVLGTAYDDQPDAYAEIDLVQSAEDLTEDLLLIHGTDDTNVNAQHTMLLSAALREAGRPPEVVLLEGQRHHLNGGADIEAMELAGRFLLKHLLE